MIVYAYPRYNINTDQEPAADFLGTIEYLTARGFEPLDNGVEIAEEHLDDEIVNGKIIRQARISIEHYRKLINETL